MPVTPRSLSLSLAAVALVGVGAVGCSSKKDEPSPTTTAAPAATTPGTSATKSTSSPATAAPGTPSTSFSTSTPVPPTSATPASTPTTPEDYAKGLYAAWRKGDKATADTLGTPDAVDALFAYEPTDFTFQDCQGAAGSTICTFTAGVGSIEMRVRNATGGEPVLVVEVKVTAP